MGIAGMVAKSPTGIYERLAYRHNDISAASELAALSLIRPSTTCGHLGDVVGEKLIYDAPTAHGGSGGPVFNTKGEVIGVNSAYMDGFSGGTIGVSVDSLRPLLQEAQNSNAAVPGFPSSSCEADRKTSRVILTGAVLQAKSRTPARRFRKIRRTQFSFTASSNVPAGNLAAAARAPCPSRRRAL